MNWPFKQLPGNSNFLSLLQMRWKPFDIPAKGSNIDFTQVCSNLNYSYLISVNKNIMLLSVLKIYLKKIIIIG